MKRLFVVLFISGCCTLTQAGQACDEDCKLTTRGATKSLSPVARVIRTTRESPERIVQIVRERVVETTEDMPRFAIADDSRVEDRPKLLSVIRWILDSRLRDVDRSRRVTRRRS